MKDAIDPPHFSFEGHPIASKVFWGPKPELWFVAEDVAKVLRITDMRKALYSLKYLKDYHEIGEFLFFTLSGMMRLSETRQSSISMRFSRWIIEDAFPNYLRWAGDWAVAKKEALEAAYKEHSPKSAVQTRKKATAANAPDMQQIGTMLVQMMAAALAAATANA